MILAWLRRRFGITLERDEARVGRGPGTGIRFALPWEVRRLQRAGWQRSTRYPRGAR